MRSPVPARPATLLSVARATGVHPSTVARALDPEHSHRISDDVVARVREEARRQGYRRDAVAASLRTGRSRLVGVVLPDLANPVFAPILSGIGTALAREGYALLVAEAGATDAGGGSRAVDELIGRRVDGLLLAVARRREPLVEACLKAGIPTVLVNRAEDEPRTSAVVSDDAGGMRLAVEHLAGLGHARIGHLAGPAEVSTGAKRRAGFEAAMRARGLDCSAVEVAGAYSREAGETAAASLLARHPDLTALAVSNDLLALGAYRALAARGLRCPRDVSVVGHNDMPLVDMVEPPLTTVRIGHVAMGEEAARLLVRAIAGGPAPVETLVTPAELVLRGSTAPPPRRRRRA